LELRGILFSWVLLQIGGVIHRGGSAHRRRLNCCQAVKAQCKKRA
jgi:hypothetical protein